MNRREERELRHLEHERENEQMGFRERRYEENYDDYELERRRHHEEHHRRRREEHRGEGEYVEPFYKPSPVNEVPQPILEEPGGQKVYLYNLAHKHYLHADSDGSLKCHNDRPGQGCTWEIFKLQDNRCHIKNNELGTYMRAREDGSFGCGGHEEKSTFLTEHMKDGSISIKAEGTSWYLGISMFGHIETVNHESNDRCHWRMELASL